ncbi:hypothetical protein X801_04100, partial [Opisthorchis viverrini]
LLSSPIPKVTSTADSFTVGIPTAATEATIAVWSGFSKLQIYRPFTHHVTLPREKCATYGVQLQIKSLRYGTPSSLLEVVPDDTGRPGRPQLLTSMPVGDHLIKVKWNEPMNRMSCPHKYVVKQTSSRGIEAAVVHIPATEPLVLTLQNRGRHISSLSTLLTMENGVRKQFTIIGFSSTCDEVVQIWKVIQESKTVYLVS